MLELEFWVKHINQGAEGEKGAIPEYIYIWGPYSTLIDVNMIYLSAQDVGDTHFVVVHYRSEMVSGEKVGF